MSGCCTFKKFQGFHVLCSPPKTPNSGLHIRLKNSTPTTTCEARKAWRSIIINTIQHHYIDTSWDFLCVELFEGSKCAELLLLNRSPQLANNKDSSSASILTLWLFPFVKIIEGTQLNGKARLTNGTATTNGTEQPKVVSEVVLKSRIISAFTD